MMVVVETERLDKRFDNLEDLMGSDRVLVMGGSSGIGEATAALFAADGAEVTITGRDAGRLAAAAERIGHPVRTVALDSSSDAELAALFDGGGYDRVILALSGRSGAGPLATLDEADLRAAFDAKFWQQLRVIRAALPTLPPTGSITLITAASARAALPGTAGLAAINGALESLVGPLAAELAPIRVNAVSPGVVDTPWWDTLPAEQREALFADFSAKLPVGRVGTAEEVARAVHMVATNGYITGSVLECDGGGHLATGG